jgi:hypothetical protein
MSGSAEDELMRAGLILLFAAQAGAIECKNVPGAAGLLNEKATVLVGEARGTKEIPYWFGELACLAANKKVPMLIGLEFAPPELAPIEKFLGSGDPADLMKAGPFAKKKASTAMMSLLERIRMLRSAGALIRLVLFDAQPGDASLRPLLMGRTLTAARAEAKRELLLVLLDEKEAALTPGTRTVASMMKDVKISFVSLHAGQASGKVPSVQLDPKLGTYNGALNVGPTSVSPPVEGVTTAK